MPIAMLLKTSRLVDTTIDRVSRICRMTAFRGHEATFAPQTLARLDRTLTPTVWTMCTHNERIAGSGGLD